MSKVLKIALLALLVVVGAAGAAGTSGSAPGFKASREFDTSAKDANSVALGDLNGDGQAGRRRYARRVRRRSACAQEPAPRLGPLRPGRRQARALPRVRDRQARRHAGRLLDRDGRRERRRQTGRRHRELPLEVGVASGERRAWSLGAAGQLLAGTPAVRRRPRGSQRRRQARHRDGEPEHGLDPPQCRRRHVRSRARVPRGPRHLGLCRRRPER